jgi:hypothetical protein
LQLKACLTSRRAIVAPLLSQLSLSEVLHDGSDH